MIDRRDHPLRIGPASGRTRMPSAMERGPAGRFWTRMAWMPPV